MCSFLRKYCKNEQEMADYGKIYETQMQTLKSRGCAKEILRLFLAHKDMFVQRVSKMPVQKGHIPFLPVGYSPFFHKYSQDYIN